MAPMNRNRAAADDAPHALASDSTTWNQRRNEEAMRAGLVKAHQSDMVIPDDLQPIACSRVDSALYIMY